PLRAGTNAVQIMPRSLVEHGGIVLRKRLAEAVDGAEWSPQVVRHRIGEGIELSHRTRQLARAFGEIARQLARALSLRRGVRPDALEAKHQEMERSLGR